MIVGCSLFLIAGITGCQSKEEKAAEQAMKLLEEQGFNSEEAGKMVEVATDLTEDMSDYEKEQKEAEEKAKKEKEEEEKKRKAFREKHEQINKEEIKKYEGANVGTNVSSTLVMYEDKAYQFKDGIIYELEGVNQYGMDPKEKKEVYRDIELFDTTGNYKGRDQGAFMVFDDAFVYSVDKSIKFVNIKTNQIVKTLTTETKIDTLMFTPNGLIYGNDGTKELRFVDLASGELSDDELFQYKEKLFMTYEGGVPFQRFNTFTFTGTKPEDGNHILNTDSSKVKKIEDKTVLEEKMIELDDIRYATNNLYVYDALEDKLHLIDDSFPYLFNGFRNYGNKKLVMPVNTYYEIKGKNGSVYNEQAAEFYLYETKGDKSSFYALDLENLNVEKLEHPDYPILNAVADNEGKIIYFRQTDNDYNLFPYVDGVEGKQVVETGDFESANELKQLVHGKSGHIYFESRGFIGSNWYRFEKDLSSFSKWEG